MSSAKHSELKLIKICLFSFFKYFFYRKWQFFADISGLPNPGDGIANKSHLPDGRHPQRKGEKHSNLYLIISPKTNASPISFTGFDLLKRKIKALLCCQKYVCSVLAVAVFYRYGYM
jgi:hypothetical protein